MLRNLRVIIINSSTITTMLMAIRKPVDPRTPGPAAPALDAVPTATAADIRAGSAPICEETLA